MGASYQIISLHSGMLYLGGKFNCKNFTISYCPIYLKKEKIIYLDMHTHSKYYNSLHVGFSDTITFWNGKHPRGIVICNLFESFGLFPFTL